MSDHAGWVMTLPPSSIVNQQTYYVTYTQGYEDLHFVYQHKKILIAMLVLSTPAPALAVEEEFCAMVI